MAMERVAVRPDAYGSSTVRPSGHDAFSAQYVGVVERLSGASTRQEAVNFSLERTDLSYRGASNHNCDCFCALRLQLRR